MEELRIYQVPICPYCNSQAGVVEEFDWYCENNHYLEPQQIKWIKCIPLLNEVEDE